MAAKLHTQALEIPKVAEGCITPLPSRRIALKTLKNLRREQIRVYLDARAGLIQTAEATRLVYMLDCLRKTIEGEEIENRVQALENIRNAQSWR